MLVRSEESALLKELKGLWMELENEDQDVDFISKRVDALFYAKRRSKKFADRRTAFIASTYSRDIKDSAKMPKYRTHMLKPLRDEVSRSNLQPAGFYEAILTSPVQDSADEDFVASLEMSDESSSDSSDEDGAVDNEPAPKRARTGLTTRVTRSVSKGSSAAPSSQKRKERKMIVISDSSEDEWEYGESVSWSSDEK